MKYLKYFEQASAYEAYKNGSDYVLPNVSYVEETNDIKFNPIAAAANLIEFTINGTPYQAEEGMTWQEFVESSYNDGNIIYDAQYYSISYNGNPIFNNGRGVDPDTEIISGTDYTSEEVG